MDEMEFGPKIRKMRNELGLTQSEVAKALGVTPGYISNVENGRTALSLRLLIYFARLRNTTLDSLVGDLEPEYKSMAQNNELVDLIYRFTDDEKEKLIATIKIWKTL